MVGQTILHYEILEKLGEGGMGVVYKARDLKLDRLVAVKFLPPHVSPSEQENSRFIQEAKSASALNHPNVCTIYGIEESDGRQFIVMELIDGITLRGKIGGESGGSSLTMKQVIEYGLQISDALQEAHSKGIIHRDIKSENIMVNVKNQIKVMDFGLAKLKGSLKLTRTSSTIGTLAYMSPEQIQGSEADARSDIFSFGAVLFEMTTGRTPFRGDHEAAMMYSIVNEEPESATTYRPEAPPELLYILRKCFEKDPDDRYQSMSEIIVDLRRLKKESTRVVRTQEFRRPDTLPAPAAAPTAGVPRTTRIPKKYLIGGAIALGLVAVALIGWFTFGSGLRGGNDEKIVAVLPFENLGPSDKDYFVDGMTDEVTSRLSGLSGLKVIARSSAVQYRKTTKSLKQIGAELGAAYLLQSTVRWEDLGGETHVRVNPTLIKVSDGTQVWSESMESVVSSAFTLQSDIASRVAGALDVALAGSEAQSLEAAPTKNSEAYDLYLQGIQYADRSEAKSDLEIGAQLLEKAIRLDPKFAAAYAKLSYVHSNVYWFFYDRSETRLENSRLAAEKALELDPRLSEAHEAMGWYYYHGLLDYRRALDEFSQALKFRPSNSNVYFGIAAVLRRQGDMRGSVEAFKKCIDGNPRAADIIRQLGETQSLLRDYAEADGSFGRAGQLTPDASVIYYERMGNLLAWKGDLSGARQLIDQCRRSAKDDEADRLVNYMEYLVDLFDRNYDGAERALAQRTDTVDVDSQFEYAPPSLLRAGLESARGDQARARKYYEMARDVVERKLAAAPHDERYYGALGIALAGLGRKDEAVKAALHSVELLPVEKEAWRGAYRIRDLAKVYLLVGEEDKAMDELQRLLSSPTNLSGEWLKLDPFWAPLVRNKRFQDLVNSNM